MRNSLRVFIPLCMSVCVCCKLGFPLQLITPPDWWHPALPAHILFMWNVFLNNSRWNWPLASSKQTLLNTHIPHTAHTLSHTHTRRQWRACTAYISHTFYFPQSHAMMLHLFCLFFLHSVFLLLPAGFALESEDLCDDDVDVGEQQVFRFLFVLKSLFLEFHSSCCSLRLSFPVHTQRTVVWGNGSEKSKSSDTWKKHETKADNETSFDHFS